VAWNLIPDSGHGVPTAGLTGDGTNLYAAEGYPWEPNQAPAPYKPFYTSTEGGSLIWTQMDSPSMINGNQLAYDKSHNILYSSNYYAGFWRVVTE
jgi:hypothetical protein